MPGINRFPVLYLLIGLLQGLVFYYSAELHRVGATLFFVTNTLVLVGGTALQLLGEKLRQWRSVLPTLAFTLLMGGMTLWVSYDAESLDGKQWLFLSWSVSLVLLSYICACFLFADRKSTRLNSSHWE